MKHKNRNCPICNTLVCKLIQKDYKHIVEELHNTQNINNTIDMNNELFMGWYYKLFILTYGEIDDEYILNSFRTILAWRKDLIFISESIPEDVFTVNEYWLLLSLLHECIEYGTSPRGAWLSSFGEKVFEFLSENTNEDILNYYEE